VKPATWKNKSVVIQDVRRSGSKGQESQGLPTAKAIEIRGLQTTGVTLNAFMRLPPYGTHTKEQWARVKAIRDPGVVELVAVPEIQSKALAVTGISPKDDEQAMAISAILDPDVDFVALTGPAGCGKTLLAVAVALHLERIGMIREVVYTRITIPFGEDMGFLPGDIDEKMAPWAGPLADALDVLEGSNRRKASTASLRAKVKVMPMNYVRGRTYASRVLIIDEAQNLTPKQMKTLVTRAGVGTKVICTGNTQQIDSPYLSEGSSGLTYVCERMRGVDCFVHVPLKEGHRSRLATIAENQL
jgi:PhoH-like ATPase